MTLDIVDLEMKKYLILILNTIPSRIGLNMISLISKLYSTFPSSVNLWSLGPMSQHPIREQQAPRRWTTPEPAKSR